MIVAFIAELLINQRNFYRSIHIISVRDIWKVQIRKYPSFQRTSTMFLCCYSSPNLKLHERECSFFNFFLCVSSKDSNYGVYHSIPLSIHFHSVKFLYRILLEAISQVVHSMAGNYREQIRLILSRSKPNNKIAHNHFLEENKKIIKILSIQLIFTL